MESAGGLERVQSSVNVTASVESVSKGFRSRAVFRWQVLLLRHLWSIRLVWSLVKQVLFKGLLWVLNLISDSWERSWLKIGLLDLHRILLHPSVNLSIELSVLSHLFQSFVLVGLLCIFQSQLSVSEIAVERDVAHLDRVSSLGCLPALTVRGVVWLVEWAGS